MKNICCGGGLPFAVKEYVVGKKTVNVKWFVYSDRRLI
jgi:hypothetical protein